jgi:hypothetical protein
LDSGDNDWLFGSVRVQPDRIDSEFNIGREPMQFISVLLEQFLDVSKNKHPPATLLPFKKVSML